MVDPERPVARDDIAQQARQAYGRAASDLRHGKSGSAYGVKGYDLLVGVGKLRSPGEPYADRYPTRFESTHESGVSGYGQATGYTEVWKRQQQMTGHLLDDYDRWANQWMEKFKQSLIPGADPNQGKQWFKFYCIPCHGWAGAGDGPNAMTLNPKPRAQIFGQYMNKKSNVHLFGVIKGGGEFVELSPLMPAWGNILQDQDIWNLIAYLRAIARPAYVPPEDQVTPLNAMENDDFLDTQEFIELGGFLGGRGIIEGGGERVGGGRLYGEKQRTPAKSRE
ncbi:MAG: c-type cytochrome [Dehalococcoidia bacterium]